MTHQKQQSAMHWEVSFQENFSQLPKQKAVVINAALQISTTYTMPSAARSALDRSNRAEQLLNLITCVSFDS